jgi:heat shock protein HslJ
MKPILILSMLLALLLSACGINSATGSTGPTTSPVPNTPTLDGTRWRLIAFGNGTPINQQRASINFQAGRMGGNAGCNGFGADYTQTGETLNIGPIVQTEMACEPEIMKVESELTAALSKSVRFSLVNTQLQLFDASNTLLATFAPEANNALIDVIWEIRAVIDEQGNIVALTPGSNASLEFNADGMVNGFTGCNNLSGSYTLNDTQLTFGPLASTKRACVEPAANQQEQQILAALGKVSALRQQGNLLTLLASDGSTLIELTVLANAPQPSPSPVPPGSTGSSQTTNIEAIWRWVETRNSDGTLITVADPQRYTVTFGPNGVLGLQADCNSVGGSYTHNDPQISLQLGPSTMIGCPEDSQVDLFLRDIGSVDTVALNGNQLVLRTPAGVEMVFER